MENVENFDNLQRHQRLKAAMHHTAYKICTEIGEDQEVTFNRQIIAAICETTWEQAQLFATDLESFARHGKRSRINAEDVKLLVRKTPKLLDHVNELHSKISAEKQATKKNKKSKKSTASHSSTVGASILDSDEDSRQ